MPSVRQFFRDIQTDIFGSGINRNKNKPTYEARTYRYNSSSSRDFGHAQQRRGSTSSVITTSSTSTTSTATSSRTTSSRVSVAPKTIRFVAQRVQEDFDEQSIPGSWPEEEESTEEYEYESPPAYKQVQYAPEPSYNKIRYPVHKPTPLVRGRNTIYVKPMTISNEPMGTRRHLRSGSDVLIVHHPTPRDLEED
ncbi:hypothetical protein VTL71DRAFT_6379 [Oculimacula yallundae]|uniref:Uncharacterized protein n=1 Tax=Oculimacula yallundae TaxID=86028 RepID=A0ABR4BWT4_9HELO